MQRGVASFRAALRAAHLVAENAEADRLRARRPVDRLSAVLAPPRRRALSGEERLYGYYDMVQNRFKTPPGMFQMEALRTSLPSVARLIVGNKDWAECGSRIMRRLRVTRIRMMFALLGPRRYGKTDFMARMQVGIAYYRQCTQATLAQNKRITGELRSTIRTKLADAGLGHLDGGTSDETLYIRNVDGGISTLKYFPDNPDVRFFSFWCCVCFALLSCAACRENVCILWKYCGKLSFPGRPLLEEKKSRAIGAYPVAPRGGARPHSAPLSQ